MGVFNAKSALSLLIALTIFQSAISFNCPQCAWDEFCFEFRGTCEKCNGIPSCSPGKTFSREHCLKTCPGFLQVTTEPTTEPTTEYIESTDKPKTRDYVWGLGRTTPVKTTKFITRITQSFTTIPNYSKTTRPTIPTDSGITHNNSLEKDSKSSKEKVTKITLNAVSAALLIIGIMLVYVIRKKCKQQRRTCPYIVAYRKDTANRQSGGYIYVQVDGQDSEIIEDQTSASTIDLNGQWQSSANVSNSINQSTTNDKHYANINYLAERIDPMLNGYEIDNLAKSIGNIDHIKAIVRKERVLDQDIEDMERELARKLASENEIRRSILLLLIKKRETTFQDIFDFKDLSQMCKSEIIMIAKESHQRKSENYFEGVS